MAGLNSYVQVAPDSTGKKIRNVELVLVKADGSEHTVEAQVIALCDPSGRLISASTTELVDEIRATNEKLDTLIELIAEAFDCDLKQSLAKKGGRHFRAMKER